MVPGRALLMVFGPGWRNLKAIKLQNDQHHCSLNGDLVFGRLASVPSGTAETHHGPGPKLSLLNPSGGVLPP